MGKTVRPETIDLTKLTYDPMYASDGSIVIVKSGKPASAKLTPEKEERIQELLLEGMSLHKIAEEIRTTKGRVQEYLAKPKATQAIAHRALVVNLVQTNAALTDHVMKLTDVVAQLDRRLSVMNQELRKNTINSLRQKQGRYKAEKDNRSRRQEIIHLRKELWKRTGQKPL